MDETPIPSPPSQQPVVGASIPPPPPSSTPSRKKFLLIGAGVLLLVIIIFSGVVVVRSMQTPEEVVIPSVTPTPSVVVTPTPAGQEMELVLNEPLTLSSGDVELELIALPDTSGGCLDCISVTHIEARLGGVSEAMLFTCGGFSGECVTENAVFGYLITLLEEKENSVVIRVSSDE